MIDRPVLFDQDAPDHVADFGAPFTKLWSTNDRVHWSERSRMTKLWREGVAWEAKRQRLRWTVQRRPAYVEVHLPVPDRRRRDPSNYVGTIVKAIVDGLVDGGLWPDDHPAFVQVAEPVLVPKAATFQVHFYWR